jgi:hypothetical protein
MKTELVTRTGRAADLWGNRVCPVFNAICLTSLTMLPFWASLPTPLLSKCADNVACQLCAGFVKRAHALHSVQNFSNKEGDLSLAVCIACLLCLTSTSGTCMHAVAEAAEYCSVVQVQPEYNKALLVVRLSRGFL